MQLAVGGRTFDGPAVDLAARGVAVDAGAVVDAVRNGAERGPDGCWDGLAVRCPTPGPVHSHVAHVRDSMSFDLRAALAAVARARGEVAPERAALEAARDRLAAPSTSEVDLRTVRRRVAEAGAEERRLRERVASLRGRLQAYRETDPEAAESAAEDLSAAVERLTEVETERIAAEQRLERVRRRARDVRDARERRFGLEDEVANLERAARRSLAAAVYNEFDAAVASLPGPDADAGDAPGEYEGDPATAALAVICVADLSAPVVLSCRRFGDATAASTRLDAPVVRL